jgi:hypothetical protein
MSIVSNSSPLINLARIGRLALLPRLYDALIVPDAVWYEVVLQGAGQAGAAEIETASWIKVRSAKNRTLVRALHYELDAGEAEAKRKGLLDLVRPLLDELRDIAGFRVSERLYDQVLRDVQECVS